MNHIRCSDDTMHHRRELWNLRGSGLAVESGASSVWCLTENLSDDKRGDDHTRCRAFKESIMCASTQYKHVWNCMKKACKHEHSANLPDNLKLIIIQVNTAEERVNPADWKEHRHECQPAKQCNLIENICSRRHGPSNHAFIVAFQETSPRAQVTRTPLWLRILLFELCSYIRSLLWHGRGATFEHLNRFGPAPVRSTIFPRTCGKLSPLPSPRQ